MTTLAGQARPGTGRSCRTRTGRAAGRAEPACPALPAGRGPRGYRRPDVRVREEVCERLTDHPLLDAGDGDGEVRNGVVTLTGRVSVRAQKHLAEDIAKEVWGVRDVETRLRVQRGPTPLIGGQQRPPGAQNWDARRVLLP